MTEEQKEKAKVARTEKVAKKSECIHLIYGYLTQYCKEQDIVAAAKYLLPGRKSTIAKKHIKDEIANLLLERGVIDEVNLFTAYKVGRAEMKRLIISLINTSDVNNRLWIDFNAVEGVYTLVGQGDTVPEGWTGYTPTSMHD